VKRRNPKYTTTDTAFLSCAADLIKLAKASDALAKAVHAMFGPTKVKTGNEEDVLDGTLSDYYEVRKAITALDP
jgi:hypothetical protein